MAGTVFFGAFFERDRFPIVKYYIIIIIAGHKTLFTYPQAPDIINFAIGGFNGNIR